ncbi:hypothetical protein LCGC14_1500090 [marine sediment metagenome]|uniref:Uncharacterized protein n=1 Tax=marine sediment metagenome TaxID=412755 RepID=A0A0F9M5S7_9ZZZZ
MKLENASSNIQSQSKSLESLNVLLTKTSRFFDQFFCFRHLLNYVHMEFFLYNKLQEIKSSIRSE